MVVVKPLLLSKGLTPKEVEFHSKVIGNTQSGKPVRVTATGHMHLNNGSSWTKKDHKDAEQMHQHASEDAHRGPIGDDKPAYNRSIYRPEEHGPRAAEFHAHAADFHAEQAQRLKR